LTPNQIWCILPSKRGLFPWLEDQKIGSEKYRQKVEDIEKNTVHLQEECTTAKGILAEWQKEVRAGDINYDPRVCYANAGV